MSIIKSIKKNIRKYYFGRLLIRLKNSFENWIFYQRRKKYIPAIKDLVDENVSIISSNCFAGRIMQDLNMEYNSPTLGLYFMYPDYIEFLSHLEYYLKEAELEFVEHSKYKIGDERRANWKHWYPIGWLGGKAEIHFLHYYSEEEAASKWYRRASRVNLKKLLIIGMDQNLCTEKDILDFDKLPYEKKIMFSTHYMPGIKSNVFMKEFEKSTSVGDPYRKGHVFYKYLTEWARERMK